MRQMVLGRELRCELDGERTHDRCVGICYLQDQDISDTMFRRGLARDCPRFSGGRYAEVERHAAADGATIGGDYSLPGYCRPRLKGVRAATAMATDHLIARDAVIRQAAFDHVRSLQTRDPILSHEAIKQGFLLEGERWPLWNPQRGIFKPRGMPFLLSIRTVVPTKGARVWLAEVAVPRALFAEIMRRIDQLRPEPLPA